MGLKIRMRKQGRTNRPFYRIVVTDVRTKRDGKYVEAIGWYNPIEQNENKVFSVDSERVEYWLAQGAELSENAKALVKKAYPDLIKEQNEKELAHKAKMTAKSRARRAKAKK